MRTLLALALLTSFACSQEEDPQFDLAAPGINIISPQNNDQFQAGDTLELVVEITENTGLHEFSAVIRGQEIDTNFTISSSHLHEKQFELRQSFVLPDFSNYYKLTVKANDHNGNLGNANIFLSAE